VVRISNAPLKCRAVLFDPYEKKASQVNETRFSDKKLFFHGSDKPLPVGTILAPQPDYAEK